VPSLLKGRPLSALPAVCSTDQVIAYLIESTCLFALRRTLSKTNPTGGEMTSNKPSSQPNQLILNVLQNENKVYKETTSLAAT